MSDVPARYQVLKRLGEGSFGYVVAAKDSIAGKRVAIKKIKDAVEDESDGKRLLRELKLLRHCRGHENFIIIKDIIVSPSSKEFKDIYIVTDLMDTGYVDTRTRTNTHKNTHTHTHTHTLTQTHTRTHIHTHTHTHEHIHTHKHTYTYKHIPLFSPPQ